MFAKQRKGFEKHKSQKRLFIKIGNISKNKTQRKIVYKRSKISQNKHRPWDALLAVPSKGTAGLVQRRFFISLNSF